jgi:NAD-dependent oxidoreductase involved in siderophore biosynthesis
VDDRVEGVRRIHTVLSAMVQGRRFLIKMGTVYAACRAKFIQLPQQLMKETRLSFSQKVRYMAVLPIYLDLLPEALPAANTYKPLVSPFFR